MGELHIFFMCNLQRVSVCARSPSCQGFVKGWCEVWSHQDQWAIRELRTSACTGVFLFGPFELYFLIPYPRKRISSTLTNQLGTPKAAPKIKRLWSRNHTIRSDLFLYQGRRTAHEAVCPSVQNFNTSSAFAIYPSRFCPSGAVGYPV